MIYIEKPDENSKSESNSKNENVLEFHMLEEANITAQSELVDIKSFLSNFIPDVPVNAKHVGQWLRFSHRFLNIFYQDSNATVAGFRRN